MERVDNDLTTSVYLTHADTQAILAGGLEKVSAHHERLRGALMLYALLAKRVVIPDGATIYNPVLRDLLFDQRYAHFGLRDLLEEGVIAFAQRSAAPSFFDINAFLRRDAAFGSEAAGDIVPYLEFLESHARVRVPYDYELTAETFTAGIEGCLGEPEVVDALGLSDASERALEFMIRSKEEAGGDGYSRRTFAYWFAEELEREGEHEKARALRSVASAVYHGSAAATIGVNPVYADSFRSAAAAIHVVGIDAPIDQVGSEDVLDRELPFPVEALYGINSEIVGEIRSRPEFGRFLDAVRRTIANPDTERGSSEFIDALLDYLSTIQEPLTLVSAGRYDAWRRYERRAQVTRNVTRLGTGVVTMTGVLLPGAGMEAAAFGVTWGFGGWGIQRFLDRKMTNEVRAAKAEASRAGLVSRPTLPQAAALRRS